MKLELKYVNRELKIEGLIFRVFLMVNVGKKFVCDAFLKEIEIY